MTYYFGSEMIVCPITVPVDRESGMAKFSAWLPEGSWIDLFTGLIYEGGRTLDFYRELDKIPVLARCGSIIPLDGRMAGNHIDNPEVLEIYICAGDVEGAFALWEDNGKDIDFREENWAETIMKYEPGTVSTFTVSAAHGNTEALPYTRKYRLVVLGTDGTGIPEVYVGQSESLKAEVEYFYDSRKGAIIIDTPEIAINQDIIVKMADVQMHRNQKKERIFNFLNRAEISFDLKNAIYDIIGQINNGRNMIYMISQLQRMGLREEIMGPIMEVLASC